MGKWLEVEIIMFSKVSLTEKNKCLKYCVYTHETRMIKSVETYLEYY